MITFSRKVFLSALFLLLLVSSLLNGQWEMRYPDIQTSFITDMTFINSTTGYFINSAGSIMRTTDSGTTWKRCAQFQGQRLGRIRFLDENNGYVVSYYSKYGGGASFYYTTDGGNYWVWSNTEMSDADDFLPVSSSVVVKSTGRGAIERLDNFYGKWTTVYKLPRLFLGDVIGVFGSVLKFQKLSDRILALGNSKNAKRARIISDSVSFILRSTDQGAKWDTLWCSLPYLMYTFRFADDKTGWMGGESRRIYKTSDGGKSWTLQFSDSLQGLSISDFFVFDSLNVYAADNMGNLLSSTDGGVKWTVKRISDYENSYDYIIRFANPQKGFLTGPDLWTTGNSGESWERFSRSFKDNIRKIDFVNERQGWAISEYVIYNTTDGGYNWTQQYMSHSSSVNYFSGLDMVDSLNGWAVGGNILYHTTDGKTWQSSVVDPNLSYIRGVNFYDKNTGILFECRGASWQYQLSNYVTTDGGLTWERYLLNNLPDISSYFKVDYSDKDHLWFSNQNGFWLSRDQGRTWTLKQYQGYVPDFTTADFVDSLNGWKVDGFDSVSVTSDGGNTWTGKAKPISLQTTDLVTVGKLNGGATYAIESALYGSLVRYYSNQNYHGIAQETYTNYSLNSIAQYNSGSDAHLWAAGDGFTVLYLKDYILTDVNKNEVNKNPGYSLSQNYPNPFNPITTIAYSIPEQSHVELKIYDMLGREVSAPVNKEQSAGEYKIQFDASSLPSGIYVYTIQAGRFRDSKKLLILK